MQFGKNRKTEKKHRIKSSVIGAKIKKCRAERCDWTRVNAQTVRVYDTHHSSVHIFNHRIRDVDFFRDTTSRTLASAGLDKNQLFPCHKFRTLEVLTARLLTLLFTTFHPIETVSMSSAEFENYVFSRGGNRLIRTVLIASNGRAFFNFLYFIFPFFFFSRSFSRFSRSLVLSFSLFPQITIDGRVHFVSKTRSLCTMIIILTQLITFLFISLFCV